MNAVIKMDTQEFLLEKTETLTNINRFDKLQDVIDTQEFLLEQTEFLNNFKFLFTRETLKLLLTNCFKVKKKERRKRTSLKICL